MLKRIAPNSLLTRLTAPAALVAAISIAYGWTLGAYFVADDFAYIGHFSTFPLSSWPGLFFRDWSDGIWEQQLNELRPIAALIFIADARLWGINSGGYHLTNLLLHVACSSLVMSIAFRVLGGDRLKALAAGLIFAVHPVQSEAVIWITGRVDLLSGLGFLLGFYGFLRYREERRGHWIAVAWIAFVFGIFAKESCLVLPFVALAYDLLSPQTRTRLQAFAPYGGWLLLLGVYAYCRSLGMNLIHDMDGIDWWGEVPYGLQRAALYVASMFLFRDLMNWAGEWMTPYLGALGLLVIVGFAALAVWVASPAARQSKPLRLAFFFALVWPAVTAAPLVITYFSRRHLYMVTAGFAIGVAALLTHVWPQRRAFGVAAVSVTVVAAVQLWVGMPRWQWAQARSREISETVAELALRAEARDVLLLDVPATYHGRWVWAWSSPFALRPPFQLQDLTRRLVVIEPPDVYHPSYFWPRAGTVPRLKDIDGGWLISGRPDQPMMVRELSAEDVNYLRAEESLSEPEAFDRLIDRVGGNRQQP